MSWSSRLLREPENVVTGLREDEAARPRLAQLVIISLVGPMLFGAAVGCYVGRLHILFAAVKMPLFLLGTLAVSFLAMHLLALVAAPQLRIRQTFALCLASISTTAAGLAALAPVVALLSCTAPFPSYQTYLFLVLVLVCCVGASGSLSLRKLRRGLLALQLRPREIRRIFACWILVYGFVGSQMAWLLRPWVGSSYDVKGFFSIYRNLEGNFYEAVYRSVLNLFRTIF